MGRGRLWTDSSQRGDSAANCISNQLYHCLNQSRRGKVYFSHAAFYVCREGEILCVSRHFVLAYETSWKLQSMLSDEINVAIVTICFV